MLEKSKLEYLLITLSKYVSSFNVLNTSSSVLFVLDAILVLVFGLVSKNDIKTLDDLKRYRTVVIKNRIDR